jgi:hypothetical protein
MVDPMSASARHPSSSAPGQRTITLDQPSARVMLVSLAPSIVINGVLPIMLTNLLLSRGVQPVYALVAAAIFPLLDATVGIARARQVNVLSMLSVALIAVGAVSSLLSGDARFTLAKNSFFTGVFGVVFLATLVIDKPIMFRMGRQFATGGVPEKIAYWDSLWQYASFRRSQFAMTAIWGLSLVLEAIARIVLVYALPVPLTVMQIISEVMSYVVLGLLICWTIAYAKTARSHGEREGAARAA